MPCDDEPYFLSACDFRYGENELAANRLASRTLITSAPSVKYIVIPDVIARLVELVTKSFIRTRLNAPAFDRVRDYATEAGLDYEYTCILDTEIEPSGPRYSIALA